MEMLLTAMTTMGRIHQMMTNGKCSSTVKPAILSMSTESLEGVFGGSRLGNKKEFERLGNGELTRFGVQAL